MPDPHDSELTAEERQMLLRQASDHGHGQHAYPAVSGGSHEHVDVMGMPTTDMVEYPGSEPKKELVT